MCVCAQVDTDLRKMLVKPDAPKPKVLSVRVWTRAIPQFNIGHQQQVGVGGGGVGAGRGCGVGAGLGEDCGGGEEGCGGEDGEARKSHRSHNQPPRRPAWQAPTLMSSM